MAKHTHSSELARLYAGELSPAETARLLEETSRCDECTRQARDAAAGWTNAEDVVAIFRDGEHPGYEELERYADGDRDETVSSHIAECNTCAAHVRDLRAIRETHSAKVIPFRPLWLAAAASIAAVLAIALYFRNVDAPQTMATKRPGAAPAVTATATATEPSANRLELADGEGSLIVDHEGRVLVNGAQLAATDAADVRALLEGKMPAVPDVTSSLRVADVALLGDEEENVAPATLRYPVAETTPTAAPKLRWTQIAAAKSYQLQVTDLDFNVVFEKTLSDTTVVAEGLQPGRTYQWQVVTNFEDHEPMPSAIAKFRVASRSEQGEIARVRATDSALLLGLHYLRVGALTPAQEQFSMVEKQNPGLDLPEVVRGRGF